MNKYLSSEEHSFLKVLKEHWRFTKQMMKTMEDAALDLQAWDEPGLSNAFAKNGPREITVNPATRKQLFNFLRKYYEEKRSLGPQLQRPKKLQGKKLQSTLEKVSGSILGSCPVDSSKTRCCKLRTLDAVLHCAYGCSYCSIQTFYHGGDIRLVDDLNGHLRRIEKDLNPDQYYHIGTGQSSDSLLFGENIELLNEIISFAQRNPNLILEFKTKSANIGYLKTKSELPKNLLLTWSINPQVLIESEEPGTANFLDRVNAAREMADRGVKVGFHFHPIVRFRNWKAEYLESIQLLLKKFTPEEVVCVSLGTLTYIKPVIKAIRNQGLKTEILRMPLEEIAGKWSYPFEIKKELFSHVYSGFESWHNKVFFYFCMEDPEIWEPVFNRSYSDNQEFEAHMLKNYSEKLFGIS
jgi:spore photoproduct lyase